MKLNSKKYPALASVLAGTKKWHIIDWANNVVFDGKKFDSAEQAEDFLSTELGDAYEEDRQEYEITPDKGSRETKYLDPNDPRSGRKAK